jgi:hypothetical protein
MGSILGFHVVACTYGFWLPNAESGSGSDFVRSDALTKFGPATLVTHRKSVARKSFDFEIRKLARQSLMYPYVEFTNAQIAAIGRGITKEVETYHAASIHAFVQLRNHLHYVCGPCRYDIRRFEGRLKGAATKQLLEEGIHPLQKFAKKDGTVPSPWSVKPWVVYLFTNEDVVRSIDYTNDNLRRSRLPTQTYSFIVPYAGRNNPRR